MGWNRDPAAGRVSHSQAPLEKNQILPSTAFPLAGQCLPFRGFFPDPKALRSCSGTGAEIEDKYPAFGTDFPI